MATHGRKYRPLLYESCFVDGPWKQRNRRYGGLYTCGLVLINDRRGVLLIAPGGLNRMHKRIFPCQGPPVCQGPPFSQRTSRDSDDPLIELRRRLEEKHDPRFKVFSGFVLTICEA